jgi:hypothetical protein
MLFRDTVRVHLLHPMLEYATSFLIPSQNLATTLEAVFQVLYTSTDIRVEFKDILEACTKRAVVQEEVSCKLR